MAIACGPGQLAGSWRSAAEVPLIYLAELPRSTAEEQLQAAAAWPAAGTPYYMWMATSEGRVWASPAPMQAATRELVVERAVDRDYYLMELQDRDLRQSDLAPRAVNLWTLGRIALLAVPRDVDPHQVLGTHALFAHPLPLAAKTWQPLEAGAWPGPAAETFLGMTAPAAPGGPTQGDIVDQAWLLAKLREFTGVTPVRVDGRLLQLSDRRAATGRADARLWLRREFTSLGMQVSEEAYGDAARGGANFIARKPASSAAGGVLVLSAHLDSVGNQGADDDGAGVISTLAVARWLLQQEFAGELRVLAFDQEEVGLRGSAAYVAALKQRREEGRLIGNITIEMPAYDADNDGRLHVIDCNEGASPRLTDAARAVLASGQSDLSIEPACTNRSDHASFWRIGVPSVVVSQNFFGGDDNPCYHRACDTADGLNERYWQRLTSLVGHTALALLQP